MAGLFIEWLYLDAPKSYFGYIGQIIFGLYEYFSIELLAKTLLAPYRHDTVDLRRLPIRFWAQAIGSNLVSRGIGFILRFFVISAGFLTIAVCGIASVLFLLLWYILPLLLIMSVVYGAQLVFSGATI